MTSPAAALLVSERTAEWVFGLEWFEEPAQGTAALTARNLARRCNASALATLPVGQSAFYAIGNVPPFGITGLLRRFSAGAAASTAMIGWTAGIWQVVAGRWWFLLGYNKAPIAERMFDGDADQAARAFLEWAAAFGPEGGCPIVADPDVEVALQAAEVDQDRVTTATLAQSIRGGRRVRLLPADRRPARKLVWTIGLSVVAVLGASTLAVGAVSTYFAAEPLPVIARPAPQPPTLAQRPAPSATLAGCRRAWSSLIRDVPTWSLAELTCAGGQATAVYQPDQAIVIQDVIRDAFGDRAVRFDHDFRRATIATHVDVPRNRERREAPPLAFQEVRLRATAASTGYEIKIEAMPDIGEHDQAGNNLLQRRVTITSPLPAVDWSVRLDELPGVVVVAVTQRLQSGAPVWIIEGRIYGRS